MANLNADSIWAQIIQSVDGDQITVAQEFRRIQQRIDHLIVVFMTEGFTHEIQYVVLELNQKYLTTKTKIITS